MTPTNPTPPPSEDRLRTALAPLRGYPVIRPSGTMATGANVMPSTGWQADRTGAYIGFEDAIDVLNSLLAASPAKVSESETWIGPDGQGRPSMADDAAAEPWNDAAVRAWLLRLTNHSGAPAEVRDAALVLHDWIKP